MKTRSLSPSRFSSPFCIAALFVAACSSGGEGASGGSGGLSPSGGSTGTGGARTDGSSGGAPGSGGNVASSGGAGAVATGGRGSGGTGGATGSGGTAAGGRGGAATGGAVAGAGSGGSAPVAGRGGSAAASGGAGGAGESVAPRPSMGCDKATSQATSQWVESTVMSGAGSRAYSVRLPANYDPKRAYPVIVLLHGCGSGTNNVPMEKPAGGDAILVRGTGTASGTCWDTAANGPDVAFFDAMVADTKTRFCADEGRVFVVGYSSGSWLVNQLTCIRSTVLRGGATVTGGEAASGTCKGGVARVFLHDKDDTTNVISGSERARDRQLTQNGCDKSMQPVATEPSPCVQYPGCPAAYPVVWCATSGQMHNRQDSVAPNLFWNFFKAL